VTATLTGRPTIRAAMTARMACGRARSLEPKPPPTCSATTRTRSGGRPNALATAWLTNVGACVDSCSVTPSPSQTAMVACGSIGLFWVAAV
jgi:hypothetical protein